MAQLKLSRLDRHPQNVHDKWDSGNRGLREGRAMWVEIMLSQRAENSKKGCKK